MTDADAFLAARDLLLRHRTDIDAARAEFQWPKLERFNFALDHFDRLAAGNDAPALRFLGPGEHDSTVTFAAMSAQSNRVANHLRGLGVRRGDRVLLLLGNVPALWEAMLACCKLGAVVIPATTMLTEDDLRDRFDRGRVRHAIIAGEHAARFAPLGDGFTRIAVGGAPDWQRFEDGYDASPDFTPDGETRATDPLLLYFTSGTTAKPKLVLHSHQSYPVGHLSTMYWIGVQPGDVHLNISSPGWAKHAWSSFFAPWIAGATIVILNQARFDARGVLDVLDRARVTSFCAPPTVWRMLIQEDLTTARVHLREALAAGEPLNPEVIGQVQRAWGLTIRDGYGQTETTLQIANTPGADRAGGIHGLAAAGLRGGPAGPGRPGGHGGGDRAIAAAAAARADGRLPGGGRLPARCGGGAGTAPATRRRATPTDRSPMSAGRTTCSNPAATASARSSWRVC